MSAQVRPALAEIQQQMWRAVREPLTASEDMRERAADGTSLREIADRIVKPNDRLTSFERLELYNRQYWWRILSALAEDFQGVRAVVGDELWDKVAVGYLNENPSRSFTLRNLGARLPEWLNAHREMLPQRRAQLALDMARLEWAQVEAYDAAELPRMTPEGFASLGDDPQLKLQPHLRVIEAAYPVDDLLLRIKAEAEAREQTSDERHDRASNAVEEDERSPVKKLAVPRRRRVLIAVHRQDNSVYFRRMEAEEFAAVVALGEGKPLSEALLALARRDPAEAAAKVQQWFAEWASLGWIAA